MTTTRNTRRTARICDVCNTRPVGTGKSSGFEDPEFSAENGMCLPCGDMGQIWISHHNDRDLCNADDDNPAGTGQCWICNPELDVTAATYVARVGHTNTVAKTRGSHAGHAHPRTPKGRAACRTSIAAGNGPILPPTAN
jgi:hypothetical protein